MVRIYLLKISIQKSMCSAVVERFAPSPTGLLHLGHAYSALNAFDAAQRASGRFLVRIEDIDTARSKTEFETALFEDLSWLGLSWQQPVMRQSNRQAHYAAALTLLEHEGLTYRCTCTRGDIRTALSAPQEMVIGPDGPVYPGLCRNKNHAGTEAALRLNMRHAVKRIGGGITFDDLIHGPQSRSADYLIEEIGDIILARRDIGTSYHLAVVVDDAAQGVTHITRGEDLIEATAIHRILQCLLNLPQPLYRHHGLIRDAAGKRLAKRDDARALRRYRAEGATPGDIREWLNLPLAPE